MIEAGNRGGEEWEGAGEVCSVDKEEARGWAGVRETLAGWTLIRGESEIETERDLTEWHV